MKRIAFFVLLTFFITWTSWYMNYLCVTERLHFNEKAFHILGVFGPLFSSLIVTYLYEGREGLKKLLNRGMKIRVKFIWYLVSIIAFPVISVISILIQNSFKVSQIDFSAFNNIADLVVLLIVMLLFAPIGEEFGWRGFLLNNLQKKNSPLSSTVIVGIIWGVWHLPFFLIPGKILNDFYNLSGMTMVLFPIYTIGMSIVYSWIYNKTNQSIFVVIILHGMTNWSFETFYPNNTLTGFNLTYCIILFLGAAIILSDYKYWLTTAKAESH